MPAWFHTMDPLQQASLLLGMAPPTREVFHCVVRLIVRALENMPREGVSQGLPNGFGTLSRVQQALWILQYGRSNYSNCINVIRLVLLAARELN